MKYATIRAVGHAILRMDVEPSLVQSLRMWLEKFCREHNRRLIGLFVDFGQVPDTLDPPALDCVKRGEADGLFVMRMEEAGQAQPRGVFETLCLGADESIIWLWATQLRDRWLLPPPSGQPHEAIQLAVEWSSRQKMSPLSISHRLTKEGYLQVDGQPWTAAKIEELFDVLCRQELTDSRLGRTS